MSGSVSQLGNIQRTNEGENQSLTTQLATPALAMSLWLLRHKFSVGSMYILCRSSSNARFKALPAHRSHFMFRIMVFQNLSCFWKLDLFHIHLMIHSRTVSAQRKKSCCRSCSLDTWVYVWVLEVHVRLQLRVQFASFPWRGKMLPKTKRPSAKHGFGFDLVMLGLPF